MVTKKKKSKKTKVKEKIKCSACGSESVVTTMFDTLSVDARPIKEMEVKCLACNYRKGIPQE